jgi:exonuclease SbcD
MAEPIRVLHFADTHIGMENYGRTSPQTGLNSRVEDFIRRINEMIDYARDHEVDLVIFAGDAFKTRNPTPTYQREFAYCVRDLAALAPVVLLVGNHDLPPMAFKASSIEIYDTLAVPNVWVADGYEVRVIETRRGPVAVGAAPYPIRARLLEEAGTAGLTIAETDLEMKNTLGSILEGLAEDADQHDMPRLLTAHFTVDGAVWGSERSIMLGRDVSAPLSAVADPRWDYVALGHIHRHQNLTTGREDVPPVVYSGSIERIDFGEEGDPKGFCWVELQRGAARWQYEQLNGRPFVTLRANLRESTTPTQDVISLIQRHNVRDAVVRLILDMTPDVEAQFNEAMVRDALRQAGANFVAAIRKEVEHTVRARLGDSPEGLTDPQLLDRYLISKQVDEARRQQLLEAAEGIFETARRQESST